jgi:hypothetical protein
MMNNFSFDEAMCFAYGSTMLTGGSSIGIMDNGEHYVPKYGYVVGGIVPEKSIDMDNEAHFKHTYNRFYYQAGLALERESAVVIGTWVEHRESGGFIVFDLCNVLDDMKSALELASKRGERAIYDLENEREIFVNHEA